MKKASNIAVFLVLGAVLFFGGSSVLADAPSLTMDPIGPLAYPTFPQNYNVTGAVGHSPNLNPVSLVSLYVNAAFESSQVVPNGSGSLFNFTLPWSITGPGTYTLEVRATHGSANAEDSEVVVVTSTVVMPPIVVDMCPAAPSHAAHYLKEMGVKAGSKAFKNVVSLVAQNMGPESDFNGIKACDMPAYATAVKAFVDVNWMAVAK